MSFYSMTMVSRNKKTGPIPVVTASRDSCPTDCPLLNKGCYADHGPLRLVWDRVSKGVAALTFEQLVDVIRRLPRGQLWRYGQAGDLPDSPTEVLKLARASRGRKAIVYTHRRDVDTYREAGKLGFNINLSASDLTEADELHKSGLPVVVVLPSHYQKTSEENLKEFRARLGGSLSFATKDGNRVAICPATYMDTTCSACQACAKPRTGGTIIGFPAHGSRKKQIDDRESTRSLQPWVRTKSYSQVSLQ